MEIFNNISTPSLNVNPNESRQAVKQTGSLNPNAFKDAFKLDINPKYLGGELEKVAIADSEALFYTHTLDIVKKD